MLTRTLDWLDNRSGIRSLVALLLLEGVPGGARWRYVWGSCLTFVFSIQLITGVLLMTAYSPSSTQAWSSVHFIQYQMDFGWFIRGLHHFGSQTMMVLIGLHMLQVVIAGAQLPPREVNWWLGLGLFGVTFGLSLTGYLLPWDQKGFWATRVATNISNNVPIIGPEIRQLLVGGEDYGNHTLTRFYALHVAILPGTLIVLLFFHIMIFRRQGVTSKVNVEGLVAKPENEHAPGSEIFWPRQAFYDMVVCMVIFGVMLGLVFYGHGYAVESPAAKKGAEPGLYDYYDYWARAGQRGLGANLDAAADRETPDYPARPEWYFLFLFQLLKYFEGEHVLIGTVHIPNGVVLLLAILPLLGYGRFRTFGYVMGIVVVVALLLAVGVLTVLAFMDDSPDGIFWGTLKNSDKEKIDRAKKFQKDVMEADRLAQRACQLALDGSPVEGGHLLLRHDPLTRGRTLFLTNCGGCHSFTLDGKNAYPEAKGPKSASDLGDYASEKWIRGLLDNPMHDKYFGLVKKVEKEEGMDKSVPALTRMSEWRKRVDRERAEKKINAAEQDEEFNLIAKWLADQAKPKGIRDQALAEKAQAAFFNKKRNRCSTCHGIEKLENGKYVKHDGDANIPDLTDYGSSDWIRSMIMRPGHTSRYGDNNLMPAFRNVEGPGSELLLQEFRETYPKTNPINLSDLHRELIIRWIQHDYQPIYGGTPIK